MPEAYRFTLATAGRQIDQRARNSRSGTDRHRAGAHHGVVQLTHGQCPHQQIDFTGLDLLATGGRIVLRFGDEGDLWRMLTLGRFLWGVDQPHAQSAGHPNRLETRQRLGIAIDIFAQLSALIANVFGVDEYRWDARSDHGRLQRADTRHLKLVHKITGGEHGAALAVIFRRVDEFQHDFRCGKGHSIQLEITQLLYLAIGDRHVGDDGLANVGLPDPYRAGAVVRNTRRIDQPSMDGKGACRRRQIATVTAPVDEGAVDGDLAVEVVDIVIRLAAF